MNLTYGYDQAGDPTATTDAIAGTTATYTARSTGGAQPHLPASIVTAPGGTQTLTPDAAGQVTSLGSTAIVWNVLHQQTSITAGGTTSVSSYYADGTRALRADTTSGVTTQTLYPPDQEVTRSSAGAYTYTRYIHEGSATVAAHTDTGYNIVVADGQGTPQISIASGTNAISRTWNTPYGAQRATTGTALPGQRRFLNHVQDPSGILDDGARPLATANALFMAPDPLAAASATQGTDPYAYAADNPTTLADPSGLDPCGGSCNPVVDPHNTDHPGQGGTGAPGANTNLLVPKKHHHTSSGGGSGGLLGAVTSFAGGVTNGLWNTVTMYGARRAIGDEGGCFLHRDAGDCTNFANDYLNSSGGGLGFPTIGDTRAIGDEAQAALRGDSGRRGRRPRQLPWHRPGRCNPLRHSGRWRRRSRRSTHGGLYPCASSRHRRELRYSRGQRGADAAEQGQCCCS